MTIYLIRHGRQSSKLCNVNAGLAEEGFLQAGMLGERLLNKHIDAVYSSDLIRAVQTAKEANRYWKVPHMIRPELREISFGDMEGMTDQDIAVTFREFKKEQARMERDLPYPGGECAADVIKRAMPVLKDIVKCGHQNVAVVTHGGVIRAVVAALLHMDPKDYRILGNSLENCSITELHFMEASETFLVERFNDYAHLEAYPKLLRAGWVEAEN
ncbi:histidine phosphatase family protein [Clostridium sp. HBUAS56010]|uniref:histidine phosphatase family protein n=1 Tax=Clostridium sp. HBUAS56010 TaxID=2571127 RepID=UPI0011776DD5|nr:histidine phosphatase family protein [Clostridium sp. HBUAS56010]